MKLVIWILSVVWLIGLTTASEGAPAQVSKSTKMDYSLWEKTRNYQSKYPFGGIDPESYVHWVSTPPDPKPLQLIKAGKNAEAFQYCFDRIGTTKGDVKFYFSIQAASLSFGVLKIDKVVDYLGTRVAQASQRALERGETDASIDSREIIALRYAILLAYLQFGDDINRKNVKLQSVRKLFERNPRYEPIARNAFKGLTFKNEDQQLVAAVVYFLEMDKGWERRLALINSLKQKHPSRPELLMVERSFRSVFLARRNITEEEYKQNDRLAERALALNPNYDRAMYAVAYVQHFSDTRSSETLIRKYLALGTGPKLEIARANALLDYLKKVDKTK